MQTKKVLLIEDNDGDIELTKLTSDDCQTKNTLHVIKDGLVALNYLLKRDPYKDSQTHDLVLLDIKLPSKNGFEIPKELRANTALNNLKVIMLTTGDSVESFEENYQVKANDYLEKPILLDKLDQCLSSLN